MSTVHSVSEITNILSGIIKNESTLQKVRVQGSVSVDGPKNVFFLYHAGEKIRCFIPDGKVAIFKPLLKAENMVIVNGNIQIFPAFSEYQIRVENVQPLGVKALGKPPFTVSKITNKLADIIANSCELQEIDVRGEISELAQRPGVTFWFLKNVEKTIPAAIGYQQIHCVLFDDGLIPNGISVNNRNQIRTIGKIQIWGAQSRYQINVTDIKPDDNPEQCQCSGCSQCGSRCNRPREVADFESCAGCLSHPSDELYALCPECYAVSPDRENLVKDEVYAYFDRLEVNGFSPNRESPIQFGSRNGNADVMLADGNGTFAAIAECKGAGYVGPGIDQLKSYLSATDTRFGVFANRADPEHWKFYENRRRNRFNQIDRSEFEAGVVEGIVTRERLKHEIAHLNVEIIRLKNQRSELDTAVNRITQIKHNLTEHNSKLTQRIETLENYKSELHEEIHRKLDNLLEKKIQRLESPLSDLKIELQKRSIKNWFKNLFSKENK